MDQGLPQQPVMPELDKPYSRHVGFWNRRFSYDYYLGWHLTAGLGRALLAAAVFALIAANVLNHGNLVSFDHHFDEALPQPGSGAGTVTFLLKVLSQVGSTKALAVLIGITALVLLLRRRGILALAIAAAMVLGGLCNLGLKETFRVERPPLYLGVVKEGNWGFPSGHAMGSTITYGLIAYLLIQLPWRHGWARRTIISATAVLVLLIGFSRLYLHAHYFSQVIAGFAAGAAWLALGITAIEVCRRYPGWQTQLNL